jgi:hypothetical protein
MLEAAMSDDTRDLVIELRADVAALKQIVAELTGTVTSLRGTVLLLEQGKAIDAAQRSMLMWLGAAVIAAAGGMGAIVAKLAGWVTISVGK